MARSAHSSAYVRIRKILQRAREDINVTQAELASRLGKPQSFISKIESGERRLDVVEFIAICRALRLDPIKLLKRIDDQGAE